MCQVIGEDWDDSYFIEHVEFARIDAVHFIVYLSARQTYRLEWVTSYNDSTLPHRLATAEILPLSNINLLLSFSHFIYV